MIIQFINQSINQPINRLTLAEGPGGGGPGGGWGREGRREKGRSGRRRSRVARGRPTPAPPGAPPRTATALGSSAPPYNFPPSFLPRRRPLQVGLLRNFLFVLLVLFFNVLNCRPTFVAKLQVCCLPKLRAHIVSKFRSKQFIRFRAPSYSLYIKVTRMVSLNFVPLSQLIIFF